MAGTSICLVGGVDKRPLVFPLLKVLCKTHRILVITDSSEYRRLLVDYADNGSINDVRIFSGLKESGEIPEYIDIHDYNFVLYITFNYIPSGVDSIIYFKGHDKAVCTGEIVAELGKKDKVVHLSCTPPDTKCLSVILNEDKFAYAVACEECKTFVSSRNKAIAKDVFNVFGELIGLSLNTIIGSLREKVD